MFRDLHTLREGSHLSPSPPPSGGGHRKAFLSVFLKEKTTLLVPRGRCLWPFGKTTQLPQELKKRGVH